MSTTTAYSASNVHHHHPTTSAQQSTSASSSRTPDLFLSSSTDSSRNLLTSFTATDTAHTEPSSEDPSSSAFKSPAAGATVSNPLPNAFVDERTRDSLALPPIESDSGSSPPSSPYVSPRLPPKTRQGAVGSMSEITLPPLSSAVPMRRGAVSGASSGSNLPFPPIRLPPNDDDIPSRGPSPTLGKRASFSLGHSNHVPPGPNAHLPMPALSGSAERRAAVGVPAGMQSSNAPYGGPSSSYHDGSDEYGRGNRMADEGNSSYYYANQAGGVGNVPRSSSSYNYANASVAPSMNRPGQFSDDPYYSGAPHPHAAHFDAHDQHSRYGGHAHGAYGGSSYGGGMAGPRPGGYGFAMGPNDHLMPVNGKRPRSAPRVLSSQPRIFACQECPARFSRNHDLKRHQRGHLSVRPYPCNFCGKSFSRKDALKRHVLVKGCGKDKKGGNDSSGRRNGSGENAGPRSEDDVHPEDEHSGGDDDDHDDQADESQSNNSSSFQHQASSAHQQQQHHSSYAGGSTESGAQDLYRQSSFAPSHDAKSFGGSLYRWNKPAHTPLALNPMRAGEFPNAASSFNMLTAGRRPSASIA